VVPIIPGCLARDSGIREARDGGQSPPYCIRFATHGQRAAMSGSLAIGHGLGPELLDGFSHL